jgi:hypothetical protein
MKRHDAVTRECCLHLTRYFTEPQQLLLLYEFMCIRDQNTW